MNNKINKKINKKAFNISDQKFFAQRLSLLLSSGTSMVNALSMMRGMDKTPSRISIYDEIIKNIEHGISLSKSIKNINLKFNELLISLIQNGEASGHLSDALLQAYKHLDKKDDMKKKLMSSLTYPFFIVCATIGMTVFLILYIFPKIVPLLSSLDIELPLITRIVQSLYYFSISYGIYTLLLFALLICSVIVVTRKSYSFRYSLHSSFLKIPLFGECIKKYYISPICSMGEMLMASGKGLPEMIIFSRDSIRNEVYKKAFSKMHLESLQGIAFSVSLKKDKDLFPSLLCDMSALGERTGNLGNMLGHCANIFENDIENFLKRFSSLIEPILMVFMGLVVGSVALSIILPVYEITNHLTR